MGSPDNPGWLLDSLIDDIHVPEGEFVRTDGGFCGASQGFNSSSSVSSLSHSNGLKEPITGKHVRSETCSQPTSKASREKMRRDKMNDRFLELGSFIEAGNPPKLDKAAILLSDAAHLLTQLHNEAKKLKKSNETLQEKIKELKAEKNELRDEKQRLKADKESLEQQIELLNARSSYLPHPSIIQVPFTVQSQAAGNKLMMPVIGYPSFPMWKFMPPANIDTSQDADKCPPVA